MAYKEDIESIINTDAVGLIKEGFWWEFYAWCIKRNLEIVEIPIKHFNRKYDNTVVFKLKNSWNSIQKYSWFIQIEEPT